MKLFLYKLSKFLLLFTGFVSYSYGDGEIVSTNLWFVSNIVLLCDESSFTSLLQKVSSYLIVLFFRCNCSLVISFQNSFCKFRHMVCNKRYFQQLLIFLQIKHRWNRIGTLQSVFNCLLCIYSYPKIFSRTMNKNYAAAIFSRSLLFRNM